MFKMSMIVLVCLLVGACTKVVIKKTVIVRERGERGVHRSHR